MSAAAGAAATAVATGAAEGGAATTAAAGSTAAAGTTATAAGLAFTIQPRLIAAGVLLVAIPWYLCRRRPASSSDDSGDFEMDDTGRRRRIMHGDL
mmetsp:Transcript_6680/g.20693  ORF Transcript_6680/g.20693 Transcript_6680/m.20693 type:complete len:96 (-) Transcript_6680:62-349(-)